MCPALAGCYGGVVGPVVEGNPQGAEKAQGLDSVEHGDGCDCVGRSADFSCGGKALSRLKPLLQIPHAAGVRLSCRSGLSRDGPLH